ncbi:MAG: glycoside hydrolase family 3 C-terminal domain-containing protein, partial [Desulfobacterales bacterium]|nr:glycoside hydrolase family 3 C-terminal domain-containing protein [Desulfobacterales bacterium]
LKNEDNILPLDKGNIGKIALLGHLADNDITGDHGSSWVNPPYITSVKQGLQNQLDHTGIELVTSFDNEDVVAAQSAAKDADAVIIVAGSTFEDEGESLGGGGDDSSGFFDIAGELFDELGIDPTAFSLGQNKKRGGDRSTIRLKPEEIKLIKEVAKVNKNVILITFAGAAIIYEDILEDTKAIVMGWFAGMEGGNAISDILFGKINPSGKTPCTFAKDESDYVELGSGPAEVFYDYYHGYMKTDKEGTQPRYPFGFGLSYTTYAYGNEKAVINGNKITASFDVSNTGDCDGEEIAQVYVGKAASAVDRPTKTMQGFKRVAVSAGATVSDSIDIHMEDLKYYDESSSSWILEKGEYLIYIGNSSAAEDLV